MSDTPTDAPITQSVVGNPTDPPAAPAGTSVADPLAGMTEQQIDALGERIAQARANRPEPLVAAFERLEHKLTATHRDKEAAVETRKEASGQADQAVEMIAEIKRTLRRTQLAEAAAAAQFASPAVVAQHLESREGDVTELITDAAKSGAFAMKTPATSATIGGPASQTPAGIDPGVAAIIAEVNAAHGR